MVQESEKKSESSGGVSGIEAPSISLPKGGGAIRGIGEKFAANPVTGSGFLSVPIPASPGRSGFGPELSLSYDSGAGNGPFGFGWRLTLPSITRKTEKGLPRYLDKEESDVYILSGAEDLVPVLNPDGSVFEKPGEDSGVSFLIRKYRPRIEGLFARIERWTNIADGDVHWRSISRDNITSVFGRDAKSRIADPSEPSRVFSWLICESYDDKGNAILYQYAGENDEGIDRENPSEHNRVHDANRYIKRIRYGNREPNRKLEATQLLEDKQWVPFPAIELPEETWMFELVFDYGEGHYKELDLDPNVSEKAQHRFVYAGSKNPAGTVWPARPDPFSTYRSGFEIRTHRRCQRVLMFHHIPDLTSGEEGYQGLVRATEFDYQDIEETITDINEELSHQGSSRFASFITRITQSGYVKQALEPGSLDDAKPKYLKKSFPPLEFEYSKAKIRDEVLALDEADLENLPEGMDGANYQWVDLEGEGVSGFLTEQAGSWFYKENLGDGRFGPLRTVLNKPSLAAIGTGDQRLVDLDGDGQLELADFSGVVPGFYSRTADGNWESFKAFKSLPNIAWNDPNLRMVDLSGDGHADVLITENEVFTWYQSLGREGFKQANQSYQLLDEDGGARLIFADGTQSIYLADMSGDGLADLLRIRNGEICYWPNLGYGRFGPQVCMDNAPWFDHQGQFDQQRIRIADIDGSGTTDIIYLTKAGAKVYFNQSGNRISNPRLLRAFSGFDDFSSVTTADLLGTGTACLVWSSSLPANERTPLQYIDLMSGIKPHLLIKTVNNLGAETEVHYVPSTRFYLDDKKEGRPWITRLPFPVHVIERVVTHDRISRNLFTTRYAYHHGYFDGTEREFRGFAFVEQWDTEEFGALNDEGEAPDETESEGEAEPTPPSNLAAESHIPPVHTKTWYHTGAYLGRMQMGEYFAGLLNVNDVAEYFREPGMTDAEFRQQLLDNTVLPAGLAAEEEREACRALKGTMLRQEVYALDASSKREHPYTVTEQNLAVKMLQGLGGNRHAVFLTHANEQISYHYERNPADPRVAHALTLGVDDFGNVLKSAAVAYGRRKKIRQVDNAGNVSKVDNPGLAELDLEEDRDRQTETHITVTENRFTKSAETGGDLIDNEYDYRLPLPYESITYELTSQKLASSVERLGSDDVLNTFETATTLDYEKTVDISKKQKRTIEHVRTYFRRDNLDGALPLGTLESKALPFESCKLAFTKGLLSDVFGNYVSSTILEDECRYRHGEGDENWWIPSGQVFYSPTHNQLAPDELKFARDHFFLPHRYRDPFHTDTNKTEVIVTYDEHKLLVRKTKQPRKHLVTAVNDYRVLQPKLITDPNKNRSQAAFDAMGFVAGTAVMGKGAQAPQEGDDLLGFEPNLTDEEIDQFLANPKGAIATTLLANASTRIIYDVTAYSNQPDPKDVVPAMAATLARETHANDPLPQGGLKLQVSFSYSDGFGREIQKKIQAEPGPVPTRDVQGKIILGVDRLPIMSVEAVNPRWVGTGWTVFNNKGKPVRQYEPFFTDTHEYEFDVRIGVSPVLFYDPAGRTIGTLHPNHAWEKVVFDPWHQKTSDVNDNVLVHDPAQDADIGEYFARLPSEEYLPSWHGLRTDPANSLAFEAEFPDPIDRDNEKQAALQTELHAETPTVAWLDSLGRAYLTKSQNKYKYTDKPDADPPEAEVHYSRVEFDIEGNQREVVDALDRVVMQYDYDMLGNRIHQSSMEAGERWMLNDVAGNPVYAWDSLDHRFRTDYDELRRPTKTCLMEGSGQEIQIGRTVYGDSLSQAVAEAKNLIGKVLKVHDQSGVLTTESYDFKGNLLESKREIAKSYKTVLNWSANVPLEPEKYISKTLYDALDRPVQLIAPHSDQADTNINVIQPQYNEANLLEKIDAWLNGNAEPVGVLAATTANLHAVTNIDYDAKGQRHNIDYGTKDGKVIRTAYAYDRKTFRLRHLYTRRGVNPQNGQGVAFDEDCENPNPPPDTVSAPNHPPQGKPCGLQNLHYTYDPVGNITQIRDTAQQTIYFQNKQVEASSEYLYDALYRLIEATGREHLGQGSAPIPHSYNDAPRVGIQHPGDGNAVGRYIERYVYDFVGNFKEMKHRRTDSGNAGWTRSYDYLELSQIEAGKVSNRLTSTTVGANPTEKYSAAGNGYDDHGNMLRMPHLQAMQWDFKNQLRMTQRQKIVSVPDPDGELHHGERTWYVYDASGERVRKVTELSNGSLKDERLYLGGFEIYRNHSGNHSGLVRETLHVMDDQQRIALIEKRNDVDDGTEKELIRYQLGNHLGSASLELNDQAQIASYEEYTPYGSTAYQGVRRQTQVLKRYRFTGMERDEESGLGYHGSRYYAVWLGTWISADPIGVRDGLHLYRYVSGNPIRLLDQAGKNGTPWEKVETEDASAAYYQNTKTGTVIRQAPGVREVWAETSGVAGQYVAVYQEFHFSDDLITANNKSQKATQKSTPQPVLDQELEETVGEPGFAESLIPIWGSARSAVNHAQKGEWGWAVAYGALAVSDVFLVKSLATAGGKLLVKGGGMVLGASALKETGKKAVLEAGEETVKKTMSKQVAKQAVQETTEQTVKYASPSALGTLVGTSTKNMRSLAARRIAQSENHPLKFLLNESGKFKSLSSRIHPNLANNPDILEMGHITSKLAGGTERVMLQTAWHNQYSRVTVEGIRKGAYLENTAIDIGGIAVDLQSALWWEEIGYLAKGTVANAPRLVF